MWKDNLGYAAGVLLLIGLVGVLPAAAAETGTIAFMSARDGTWAIYTTSPGAADAARLTVGDLRDCDPAWSPDGSRIAFVSYRDGDEPEIYVMHADGTDQTRLTANDAWDGAPSWSPDGSKIAFASHRGGDGDDFGDSDIYVMNADGTGQVCLMADGDWGSEVDPAWSPDGKRIAFASDRDGDAEIYAMRADGSLQVRLTWDGAWDCAPAWSPDGTRIAFATDRNGESDVYAMKADGTNVVRLTDDPSTDGAPAWSPDGSRIAFETFRDGAGDIWVMNADGSAEQPLVASAAFDGMPAWSGATAPAEPLTADFDTASTARKAQLSVQFTDRSSGEPVSWQWSFGDGTSSSLKSPSHKYRKAGTYTVRLTVKDASGRTAQVEKANLIRVVVRK